MRITALLKEDVDLVRPLVVEAMPYDRIADVLDEKLLGSNGARPGTSLVAWDGQDAVGVVAIAGRWIKLLAVAPRAWGQGIGSKLLAEARTWTRSRGGGGRLRLMDHPGNYLSPGLDARAEQGRAFLEKRGFIVKSENQNLRVPLVDNPKVTEARAGELLERTRSLGFSLDRVSRPDGASLLKMVSEAFAPAWAVEVERAMSGSPSGVFCVSRDGLPVAFAAHDGNNRGLGWFGPAGTLTQYRGQGLGEALLLQCLVDVRDRPEGGIIAWIGPRKFYQQAAGAVDDRRFVVYEEASESA